MTPGRYTAAAVRIVGPHYIARWKRTSVGICFRLMGEPDKELVLFRNLANGTVKRGSDYYRDWTRANGSLPARGQKLNPNVFLESQIYEIEVCDAGMDSEGDRKSDAEIYSKVKRIVSVQRNGSTLLPMKQH